MVYDFFTFHYFFSPTTSRNGPCVQDKYGFAEAIDKSLLFYEAQRSGDLPESEMRIKWRKDSAMNDRGNNGEDLTGGYYDGTATTYTTYTQKQGNHLRGQIHWTGLHFFITKIF